MRGGGGEPTGTEPELERFLCCLRCHKASPYGLSGCLGSSVTVVELVSQHSAFVAVVFLAGRNSAKKRVRDRCPGSAVPLAMSAWLGPPPTPRMNVPFPQSVSNL